VNEFWLTTMAKKRAKIILEFTSNVVIRIR